MAMEKVKDFRTPMVLNAIDAATGLVIAQMPIKDKMQETYEEVFQPERNRDRQEALKVIALKLLKKENGNYDAVSGMLDFLSR